MSPQSRDPEKRARQLANLRRGGGPNDGQFQPGQPGPRLRHGLRTRPTGGEGWDLQILGPPAQEIIDALAAGAPVRDPDGEVPTHDRLAVESCALQLVIVRRALGFLTAHGPTDARGRFRPEWAQLQSARESLDRALDRLGMTPTSRQRLGLDMARTFDLAQHWAAEDAAERAAAAGDALEAEGTDG